MPYFRSGLKKDGSGVNPDLSYTVCYVQGGNTIPFRSVITNAYNNKVNTPIIIGSNVYGCHNLFTNGTNAFKQPIRFSNSLVDCSYMFSRCDNYQYPVIIPNGVVNCSYMFNSSSYFNQPVTIPNTVRDCSFMFKGSWFNQPLTIPYGVTNCAGMFNSASAYNQPIAIPNSVVNCSMMFYSSQFNNQDIFIPKSVENCVNMFCYFNCGNIYINGNPNVTRLIYKYRDNNTNKTRINVYAGRSINVSQIAFNGTSSYYSFAELGDGNGYYSSVANIYVYNNYVGT